MITVAATPTGTPTTAPKASPSPVFPTAQPISTDTVPGTILGTMQYMAPEQLEGKEADARTDIFAFGALMYELVTGKKAFEGKSQVSLMGAILEREPAPITTIQPAMPAELDRIVRLEIRFGHFGGMEMPFADDLGAIHGLGPQGVGHHVVGVKT